jgi:Bacteriophage translational regulator
MTTTVLNKETPTLVDWNESMLVEITIPKTSSYTKIKEMLTRIGIASKSNSTLYQSCHILFMDDKFWLVHFKELFALDRNNSTFNIRDLYRRNQIVALLTQWNYITPVINKIEYQDKVDTRGIMVLQSSAKNDWILEAKYSLEQDIT